MACSAAVAAANACQLVGVEGGQAGVTQKWFAPVAVTGADAYNQWTGVPKVTGGLVVTGAQNALVALDTGTGRTIWRTAIGMPVSRYSGSIAAADSVVCMVDPSGVGCVTTTTGRLLWAQLGDSALEAGTSAADRVTLYYSCKRTVKARSLADGHLLWSADAAISSTFGGRPFGVAVRGDTVYVTAVRVTDTSTRSLRADLLALDAANGHLLWTYTAAPAPRALRSEFIAPPVFAGRLVIVAELNGAWLIAVDAATGMEVWRTVDDSTGYVETQTPPTVIGDTVFSGSTDTQFYAIDVRTGQLLWRTKAQFSLWSAAVCGRVALVGPVGGGNLWVIDRATHGLAKHDMAGDDIQTVVAVSGRTAYVGSMQGVYAFTCP